MTYDILLGGQPVGKATVQRQGLYYCFDCRCSLSGDVMHRLSVRCNGKTESLGLLMPDGNQFNLQTKLPVKRLGEGIMEFTAVPKHPELRGKFIPLSSEEPFAYIRRLEDAVLQIRNGQVGIVLTDRSDISENF